MSLSNFELVKNSEVMSPIVRENKRYHIQMGNKREFIN